MTKKRISYLVAPGMVLLILSFVFYHYHLFPFERQTVAWCDMYQQVIPCLMDIKDIIEGKTGMFLNLQNAGGMSFWGVFLFFVSSPFTILVLFVKKSNIYFLVNILLILKMMLCSVTASLFFRRNFSSLSLLQNTALSVMYAFCGYTMFYYQNMVWLDMVYLFPLLLLSIQSLTEKDRITPFILVLSALITINFYLSYMIVIFLILSFGVYLLVEAPKEKRKKSILLLGLSTAISSLLTAIVWLPSLFQYLESARTQNILENIKSGSFITKYNTTGALILCTTAIFSSIPLLTQIKKKSRKLVCCVVLYILLLIPVFIEPINKMWHTGSYQAFPLRYSYMTIFFGLILIAVVFIDNNKLSQNGSRLTGIFLGVLALAGTFIVSCILLKNKYEELTVYTRTLWGNEASFVLLSGFAMVAFIGYFLLMILFRYRYLGKTAFSVLFCALVAVESGFQSSVYIGSASAPVGGYQAVADISSRIEDSSLYRVKNNKKYFDTNLLGGLGYPTLNHYSSLTSKNYMCAMKELGYSSYWMEVNSNGGTVLSDAVLGNKYSVLLSKEAYGLDKVYDNRIYTIAKNSLSLNFGIVTQGSKLLSLQKLSQLGSRFNTQEQIFQALFSSTDQLTKLYQPDTWNNIVESEINKSIFHYNDPSMPGSFAYHISVKGTQNLYFDCFDKITNHLTEPINNSFAVYVNGTLISKSYPNQKENGFLDLGTFSNEEVTILVQLLKPVQARSVGVAGIDIDLLKKAVSQTNTADLHQKGNVLSGTVNASEDGQYLFLPIANVNGCTAFINGKQQKVVPVLDSFIAVKLEKGNNELYFRFVPPGFQTGFLITILGLLMFVLFLLFIKKNGYQYIRFLEIPASVLFALLFIGVFFIIYILPVAIYLI